MSTRKVKLIVYRVFIHLFHYCKIETYPSRIGLLIPAALEK